MKERSRAYRRAQRARLRARRIRECYWNIGLFDKRGWSDGQLGVAINTPKARTCRYSKNRRLFDGETMQERRATDAMRYVLKYL